MQSIKLVVDKVLQHSGICDASAAVAIGAEYFVVANDEDNVLKVFHAQLSGSLLRGIEGRELNDFFDNNPKNLEVDIEAAAKLGKITYWITSHGRDADAKKRRERRQFFGTKYFENKGKPTFKQVGYSYTKLLKDIKKDARLGHYHLKDAGNIAPKELGGLNIEGLTVTPQDELLIGFRNPIPFGNALLLPLKNPKDLIKKKKEKAIFGEPIELDLGGLGIRSIEYWKTQACYIIIAGAYDGSDQFELYQWSGVAGEKPLPLEVLGMPKGFRTESVLFYPEFPQHLQLLSDDGMITRDGVTPCKEIKEKENPNKYFRSLWVRVEGVVVI